MFEKNNVHVVCIFKMFFKNVCFSQENPDYKTHPHFLIRKVTLDGIHISSFSNYFCIIFALINLYNFVCTIFVDS